MTKSIFNLFGGRDQGLFAAGEPTRYVDLLNGHIYDFSVNFNTSFLHQGPMANLPLLFLIFLILMLLFANKLKIISKKENDFVWTVTRIALLILLLMFLYPFPIRYWFLTGFEMFYILPLGLFLSKLLNFARAKLLLYLFFALSIFSVTGHTYNMYSDPDYGGTAKIKGKLDAIDFIYKDAGGKLFNLLIFTPPVYTFAYDYLIWWRSENKYHYIPGNEKKNTFYLLIEPDPNKPWSYEGWLKTVVKTGNVISTTKLPSGLIVEKRIQE